MALGYQLGVSAFFLASNRPQDGELHFFSPRERAERARAEQFGWITGSETGGSCIQS